MAVAGNTLYVSDIDRIVTIDITGARITSQVQVEEARFLNDVTVGKDGVVYISDTIPGRVYRLSDGSVESWLDGLKEPNGLPAEEGRLLVGTNGQLLAADIATGKTSVVAEETGYIDGMGPRTALAATSSRISWARCAEAAGAAR